MNLVFQLQGSPVPSFVLKGYAEQIHDSSTIEQYASQCDRYRTRTNERPPTDHLHFTFIRYDGSGSNFDQDMTAYSIIEALEREGVPPLIDRDLANKTGVRLFGLFILPHENIEPLEFVAMSFDQMRACADVFALVDIGR